MKRDRGETRKKNCKACGNPFEGDNSVAKCKSCRAAYRKAWAIKNAEKVKEVQKRWVTENAEYLREYKKSYRNKHPEQARESLRAWKKRNPEKVLSEGRRQDAKRRNKKARRDYVKNLRLVRHFGISLEAYNAMLAAQGGLCALCHEKESHLDRSGNIRSLCVDHCHKTGAVRQLLCNRCNTLLGKVDDDPIILEKALVYLLHHKKK